MDVVVLGTGAADGWPNPWCGCASCSWARDTGSIRTTTAALLDGVLLLDCGPDAPRQADRAGVGLGGVEAVLLTHAHHDHLAPEALLARSWSRTSTPLRVLGPRAAIDACAHWVGPHDTVTLEVVAPGDVVTVAGYLVRVLAAAHDVGIDPLARDALLFDVTGPDGCRLLYATDTGPLPPETVGAVAGAAFDLVLVEETFGPVTDHGTGHLDFDTFPRELARLREAGAITGLTDVVAVHLGHHNPVGPELDRILRLWGARTVADRSVVTLRPAASAPQPDPAPRRTLLLGGARSGKSREAELRLRDRPHVRYVATGGTRADDPEWVARVAAHRGRRPESWTTVETLDVGGLLETAVADDVVLVDCLALWLAGQLDRARVWDVDPGTAGQIEALAAVERETARLAQAIRTTAARVVVVSNEVGSGVVPEHASGRVYRDLLGRLNAQVAAQCDEVALVVAGRVLTL